MRLVRTCIMQSLLLDVSNTCHPSLGMNLSSMWAVELTMRRSTAAVVSWQLPLWTRTTFRTSSAASLCLMMWWELEMLSRSSTCHGLLLLLMPMDSLRVVQVDLTIW